MLEHTSDEPRWSSRPETTSGSVDAGANLVASEPDPAAITNPTPTANPAATNPSTSIKKAYSLGSRLTAAATLTRLLDITSNGVVVFAASGVIVYNNERAAHMLGERTLVGCRIDEIMYPTQSFEAQFAQTSHRAGMEFTAPFLLDGSSCTVVAAHKNGGDVFLHVRCDEIATPGKNYLLVMESAPLLSNHTTEEDAEHISELQGANRRLSGVLSIVLETLNWSDVASLFENVLEQLRDTMEASGTLLYLAEADGLVLRGMTSSMQTSMLPHYLTLGEGLETHAIAAGKAMRIQVLSFDREDLRHPQSAFRRVRNEETNETFSVPTETLFPFMSSILVPIWFSDHIIALIVVGWERSRSLRRDDSRLLDSIAQYLSVQLMGALTDLRNQRRILLDQHLSELHEQLQAHDEFTPTALDQALAQTCSYLDAHSVAVDLSDHTHASLSAEIIQQLQALLRGADEKTDEVAARVDRTGQAVHDEKGASQSASQPTEAHIIPLSSSPQAQTLAGLIQRYTSYNRGAVVDAGTMLQKHWVFFVLRGPQQEPLDDLELTFLESAVAKIRQDVVGAEQRNADKHIAQALQLGLRNELQQVDGIIADGIYSSATEDAFVGGDFYDLIRLPQRRACVILGDVSGHGVEAASVSAAVKTALAAYAWQGLSPAHMVQTLNRFLLGFSRLETFASLFVGVIDLTKGELQYCSAGHPPALLVRGAGRKLDMLDVQSAVVGAFEEMSYRNGSVSSEAGDTLLLYTDGVTEARNAEGAFFGERNLCEVTLREAARGSRGLLKRLLDTLDSYTNRNLTDDLAMVALTFKGDK